MKIVLASASIYRAQLLRRILEDFETYPADIDETPSPGEKGTALAARLARAKAETVAARHPRSLIIGSDQVALLGMGSSAEQVLGKPGNFENARAQLLACSGREVVFHTACCVIDGSAGNAHCFDDSYRVCFKALAMPAIENYLRREQPYDCAGSIKTEGLGIALLASQQGRDPTSPLGLPLMLLVDVLERCGVKILQ
ncbi:MAG: Maf family nucleotide pyrophosphatase [Pseudomonadales bacterium]